MCFNLLILNEMIVNPNKLNLDKVNPDEVNSDILVEDREKAMLSLITALDPTI